MGPFSDSEASPPGGSEPAGHKSPASLQRQVGVPQAVLLGLGSILGTGVYFGVLDVFAISGPAILWTIAVAGLLATCNALSSAQLAAAYPVSGGTYEYGYRLLTPRLGFAAGWMFLCAKSASAATAALATAQYLGDALRLDQKLLLPVALSVLVAMVLVVVGGIRRSAWLNALLVAITVLGLGVFCGVAFKANNPSAAALISPPAVDEFTDFLRAAALMFVAYTGYGRVATLGEEITNPQRNIPKAIVGTLMVSLVIYGVVGMAVFAAAAQGTVQAPKSLAQLAEGLSSPTTLSLITLGAVTAMLGVLLNLLLGLSRVVLAMARRHDLPHRISRISETQSSPTAAVLVVAVVIGLLVLVGSAATTWSLSAFTVLIYYGLTNLAALRLRAEQRRFPRWVSALGLAGCLLLAFSVDGKSMIAGSVILAAGLLLQSAFSPSVRHPPTDESDHNESQP